MTTSTSTVVGRSPITIAAGFLGAFIVGSLGVQLIRIQDASVQAGTAAVDPVIASPATLWAALGDRDIQVSPGAVATPAPAVNVKPVVGSEATLWSPLGDR